MVGAGHFGGAIKAGDTVWLRSGYHGAFAISGGNYATPIKVAAEAGASPRLSRASFNNSHGWLLSGLSISPSHAPSYTKGNIVAINGSSSNIVVENSTIFSIEDRVAVEGAADRAADPLARLLEGRALRTAAQGDPADPARALTHRIRTAAARVASSAFDERAARGCCWSHF